MASGKHFIPSREADLLAWSQNLYDLLTAIDAPASYGITADQVAPFATAQEAFKAAYAAATTPATRTPPSIATKNTAKKAMIASVRPLVAALQVSAAMNDAKRRTLEIPVRDREPSPVPPPTQMPRLTVTSVTGRVLNLDIRDEEGKKQKAPGATGLWLYSFVGENPSGDLTQWRFNGGSGKWNPQIAFPETVAPGTPVYVTALWINHKQQPGPACAPVKAHIGFAGLNNVAA